VIQRNLAAVESGEFVMAWRGVSPRELSDETMSWLASTPSPLSSVRPQDAHRRYFRLERGGSLVRVIDANRMKWENAVVAALKAGVAGREMTEEEAEDELPSYRWSYLPSSYQPNGCEFKAPRRARGTAPVSESLYERWLGLLDALGCTQQDYPLPELAVDAVRVVEEMSAKYHDLKSRGQHPPSARQLEYASNVAKALGIDVTFDRSSSRADVSEFLETHAAAARQMKAVHGSADRTARMKALLEAMLHGPQSAKELGSRLGLDATSVRNMLEGWRPSLVELGMAERVQTTYNGKRRVHYVATAKGERFARGSGDS
jgi:predicted transcriptional regulator